MVDEDVTSEVKEGVKEITAKVEDATDWVLRVIVLGMCTSFMVVVFGTLLLMLAIA